MARKEIYDRCRRLGLCVTCESRIAVSGQARCAECAAKKRAYNKRYAERRILIRNGKEANVHD